MESLEVQKLAAITGLVILGVTYAVTDGCKEPTYALGVLGAVAALGGTVFGSNK